MSNIKGNAKRQTILFCLPLIGAGLLLLFFWMGTAGGGNRGNRGKQRGGQNFSYTLSISDPWGIGPKFEDQFTPCLLYFQWQGKYKIEWGDGPQTLFGVPHAKHYLEMNGVKKLRAGDTLAFDGVNVQNLNDIKLVWEVYDSLLGRRINSLVIIVRDEGEAYLVVRGIDDTLPDWVIWSTRISVGMRHSDGGGPTPTGFFQIVQKDIEHWSRPYQCWMPYGQRLGFIADTTEKYIYKIWWSGWWLHQGLTTGIARSHGCIRMPKVWAKKLWDFSLPIGTYVLVVDGHQLYEKEELVSIWRKSKELYHRRAEKKKVRTKITI